MKNIEELKQEFKAIVKEKIQRDGIDDLIKYLESRDFFYAPASSRFHNSFEGGLVDHSINVYKTLDTLNKSLYDGQLPDESVAISALFHDACKMDFYVKGFRNKKNDYGRWERVETWEINELFPIGHGEKSVILLQQFIKLTVAEVAAIRWHMGAFDSAVKGGDRSINAAFEKYPLAAALHMADTAATYIMEAKTV